MIRTEILSSMPEFPWGHETLEEVRQLGGAHYGLVAQSVVAVAYFEDDIPLFVAGLTQKSFLGRQILWVLLTKNFQARHLRLANPTKDMVRHFTDNAVVTPVTDSPAARKLAKAWGFKPSGAPYELFGRKVEDYVLEI